MLTNFGMNETIVEKIIFVHSVYYPKVFVSNFQCFRRTLSPLQSFPSAQVTRIDARPPEGRGCAFRTVRPDSNFPSAARNRRTITFLSRSCRLVKNFHGPQVLKCAETLFRSERRLPFVAMRGSVHKKERGRIIYLYILYTFT